MKSTAFSFVVFWCFNYFANFANVNATDNSEGSLADILKPLVNLLECDKESTEIKQLCQLVSAQINAKLTAAGISITKDSILFSYDDPTNKDIDTGHPAP